MRLRQIFLAVTLVPAIQMSASAQKIFSEMDEPGEMLFQGRPIEIVKANSPDAPKPKQASETATPSVSAEPSPVPIPTPLHLAIQKKLYTDTYLDAYGILKEDNSCSRFFGGALKAIEVLNRLTEQFKKKPLDNPQVAVKMSGPYSNVSNRQTGASYRLFEQVLINTNGPFALPPVITATHKQAVGRFRTDTREARALILLHEIGHLLRGADGNWLLPNDGTDAEVSLQNTITVQSNCLKQLTALGRSND